MSDRNRRRGLLVMAHGTPDTTEELEPFYTRIRRGRPPSPEQLADLRMRYDAIGGLSPLNERTSAQVNAIAVALDRRQPGRWVVRYGAKHVEPTVEDAAASLADDGVSTVVGLVLTPHRSSLGSDEYLQRAKAALGATDRSIRWVPVHEWYTAPGVVDLLADRVRHALPADLVLFTAHSLPERIRDLRDPYEAQMAASARLVAEAAGLQERDIPYEVAWQSAGRSPEPWIGPDLLTVLRSVADRTGGREVRRVMVCPIGFVSDHLEVLYDLDIEAREVAASVGLELVRTISLNDDPDFADALAGVAIEAADGGDGGDGASDR